MRGGGSVKAREIEIDQHPVNRADLALWLSLSPVDCTYFPRLNEHVPIPLDESFVLLRLRLPGKEVYQGRVDRLVVGEAPNGRHRAFRFSVGLPALTKLIDDMMWE